MLSGMVMCPPHRGYSWSHHRRPCATRRRRKAKAALVEDDGPVQRGQEHKHYKGQRPKEHRPCINNLPPRYSGSCMSYRGGQSYVELPRISILRTRVNRFDPAGPFR
jgi:hypothetical protein